MDDTSKDKQTINNGGGGDGHAEMGYQQTLMYGRYSKSLGDYAKEEAKRQKILEKVRKRQIKYRWMELTGNKNRGSLYDSIARVVTYIWKHTFAKIGEDWVFLAVLGIMMSFISFIMDYGIETCNQSRLWLYQHLEDHLAIQYFAWITLPVFLVLFSSGFVHVVAPQAIGSGIPEMKTILRGVVLKEYLSARTFIAKAVGLTATLGSGMPLGKEGPFVHIASIVASSLSKLVTSFQGIYANESRNSEMLAAACAVGVACCFGSPIGGVLFSIEVTSVFFAVRNYWRGFFSAVCGAMTFRLLSIWFEQEETIVAVFMTGFKMEFPYDPKELFVFSLIGVFCGLGGALYVFVHRRYVLWMRSNKKLSKFLQKNRFIYPFFISWLISTLSFPPFTGQFQAADIGTHEQIHILFSNYTWSKDPIEMSVDEWAHVKHWVTPWTSVFVNLPFYILMTFVLSILAATLPVPTGVLIPTFKVGAAFGRLVGEAMHIWFPSGVKYGGMMMNIAPGGYATVGAAAFSGAVTHTISISVIVFEMTGQITHCIPVLIAVLISNAIASLLQPSCYDSIIMIKKLPYLPDILPASSMAYNLFVEDFMVRDIKYIWNGMKYSELKEILKDNRKLKGFPLVDSPQHMILLGSIQRTELITLIEKVIDKKKRMSFALKKYNNQMLDFSSAQQLSNANNTEKPVNAEKPVASVTNPSQENLEIKNDSTSEKKRRPSRFEVTTEAGKTFVPVTKDDCNEDKEKQQPQDNDNAVTNAKALIDLDTKPKKSILKKSNSHTIHAFGFPEFNELNQMKMNQHRALYESRSSPYQTVTGAENKFKNALENIQNLFKRPSQMNLKNNYNNQQFLNDYRKGKIDLSIPEQCEWEQEQMQMVVDFQKCHIDPAPFQLVEKTSLLKVHSLFSMLGVNHAYVTTIGRLIGVVGLKELRKAIEDANSGQGLASPTNMEKKKLIPEPDNKFDNDSTTHSMDSRLLEELMNEP